MSDHSSQEPQQQQAGKHNIPPWVLVCGIATAAFVLMLVVSIADWWISGRATPIPAGIARAVLSDGTILVLHPLTTRTKHELKVQLPDDSWPTRMGFTSPTVETVDLSDGTRFWSLWFSRHDPKTGKLLEFDDWSHCIAETKSHQVEDTDRRRVLFDQGQQLKSSSFTPPPHDHNQPRIYQSRLPVLRKDADEFQLHVYHNNHSKIATLDVPFPVGTAASPEWTPNPLPQTASDGDLDVTLRSLTTRVELKTTWAGPSPPHQVIIPNRLPRVIIEPQFQMRQRGQLSNDWIIAQSHLEDALGNEELLNDCRLSPLEKAWKLKLQLLRKDDATFEEESRLSIANVLVPSAGQTHPIEESFSFDGVTIHVLTIGGTGSVTSTFPSSRVGSSYSRADSYSRINQAGSLHMSWELNRPWEASILTELDGAMGTATVETDIPFVLIQTEGFTPDHRLSLVVTDEKGERSSAAPVQQQDMHYMLFRPPEGTQQVDLQVIVQRVRNVEFLVKPPMPIPENE